MQRTPPLGLARTPLSLLSTLIVLLWALVACGQQAPAKPSSGINSAVTTTTTNGLTGDYYDNMDFTGTKVTRVDPNISFSWGTKSPVRGIAGSTYSVRWTGQIQPSYSETYTFHLTSDDGARLMVNGQVVTDQWYNGATTTSGTVVLQAGIKYDIQLEYYENTGGSQAKLEWQSSSQTRQIVPSTALFSSGSNYVRALTLLNNDPKFKLLNTAIDPQVGSGQIEGVKFGIFARETSPNRFISASFDFSSNTVRSILRYTTDPNGNVKLLNVLNGKEVDLGNYSKYVQEDGSSTISQTDLLLKTIASAIFDDTSVLSVINNATSNTASKTGKITAQFIRQRCEACAREINTLINTSSEFSAKKAFEIYNVVKGSVAKTWFDLVKRAGSQVIGRLWKGLSNPNSDAKDAADSGSAVLSCSKNNCPPAVQNAVITPTSASIPAGSRTTLNLTFTNSQTSALDLDYSTSIVSSGIPSGAMESGGTGSVAPNGNAAATIGVACPDISGSGTITINIKNEITGGIVSVSSQVNCTGTTTMTSPGSVNLTAQVGQSVPGSVAFTNTGDQDLKYNAISISRDNITINYPTGVTTIAPHTDGRVDFTSICPQTAGTYTYSFGISNNASNTGGAIYVNVNLICTPPDVQVGYAELVRDTATAQPCDDHTQSTQTDWYGAWAFMDYNRQFIWINMDEYAFHDNYDVCGVVVSQFRSLFIEWIKTKRDQAFQKFLTTVPNSEKSKYHDPYIRCYVPGVWDYNNNLEVCADWLKADFMVKYN